MDLADYIFNELTNISPNNKGKKNSNFHSNTSRTLVPQQQKD